MHFDMEDGSLALGLEGGHHRKRIPSCRRWRDRSMVTTSFMISKVINNPKIDIFENHSVIGILQENRECSTAYGPRNLVTESEELFYADNNPPHFRRHFGYLQTDHQSAYHDRRRTCLWLLMQVVKSPIWNSFNFILRHLYWIGRGISNQWGSPGEGGLSDRSKRRTLHAGDSRIGRTGPRDIVAQSIYRQMLKYDQEYVWLSLKHLDPQVVKHRFPNIYENARIGIDMCDRIPVAPAAHYMVGGVRTDTHGRTNIKRLFICGELASSGIRGQSARLQLVDRMSVFGKRPSRLRGKSENLSYRYSNRSIIAMTIMLRFMSIWKREFRG